jgi:hypothetical protein
MEATFTQDYDPGLLNVPGYGQSAQNPLAPVFYQSMGIVEDCTVYRSLYVTQNTAVGKNVEVNGNVVIKGNLQVGGPGNFGGVVSAAGFTYGGRSFFGANQFTVEAPATFLNSLSTNGASSFGGLLSAAAGIVSPALAINPQFDQNQQRTPQNQANYQPRDADGNPINTPVPFVPCTMGQLPEGAVVLAYVPPYINPT